VLIVGASEGALIATMLLERFPQIYAGGMAIAGPLAGMPYQIKYLGDFRVVYDYFFPGLLPVPFGERDAEDYDLHDWTNFATDVAGALTADLPGNRPFCAALQHSGEK
jgi:pimeloyl-ACP methyl ester carboxylesterase